MVAAPSAVSPSPAWVIVAGFQNIAETEGPLASFLGKTRRSYIAGLRVTMIVCPRSLPTLSVAKWPS